MSPRCVDPVRVAALPWLLRTLYAPKNRTTLPPERLGETYTASAVRDTAWTPPASPPAVWNKAALSGIYVDENLRSVTAPASAYDAADRDRLWSLTQEATGNPQWAW
ncbi:hypothetical protein [Microbispora rosea]|uniref:hypothetical protein n=1 Tax=Microbispora rosea TaxID=58117 RepID=UPI003D8A8B16